jgi:tetratricopeptide (TPR) repeat protein
MSGWVAAFAVFAGFFALYTKTMAPSIFLGDSAAFAASNYILGLPHSPSFPLYTLLGRLFNLLPGLTPAFSSNLMSAFFAALSMLFFFKIAQYFIDVPIFLPDEYKRMLANRKAAAADPAALKEISKTEYNLTLKPALIFIPAIAVTILFGISLPVWLSAVRAEVYSLHLCLSLAALYMVMKGARNEDRKIYLLGFWVYALSFGNHPLLALAFAPAFIYLALINFSRFGQKLGTASVIGVFFVIAFFIYLYLPIRAALDPSINWGRPDSLGAFWAAISRSGDMASFSEMLKAPDYLLRFKNMGLFVVSQIGWPIIGLFLIGVVGMYKIAGKNSLFFPIALLFNLAIILWAADFDRKNYDLINYTAPMTALILLVAVAGGFYLLRKITKARQASLFIAVPLIALAAFAIEKNYEQSDMSSVIGAEILSHEILKELPPGSIILAAEDNLLLPLWYGAYVDSMADNIYVLSPGAMVNAAYRKQLMINYPDLEYPPGFTDTLPVRPDSMARQICRLNKNDHDIYVQFGVPGISHRVLIPSGVLFKFTDSKKRPRFNRRFYENHIRLVDSMLAGNPNEVKTIDFCARWLFTVGVYCDRIGYADISGELFDRALTIDKTSVDLRLKLATALAKRGRFIEALKYVADILEIDSRNRAGLKLGQGIVRAMEKEKTVASR